MTLKAVTKADQGFYICHHPIAGRTNDLWIAVKRYQRTSEKDINHAIPHERLNLNPVHVFTARPESRKERRWQHDAIKSPAPAY